MVDLILKISRPGVYDVSCLNGRTTIIMFMKNVTWIEDGIKVITEFTCLLGHPVWRSVICMLQVTILNKITNLDKCLKEKIANFERCHFYSYVFLDLIWTAIYLRVWTILSITWYIKYLKYWQPVCFQMHRKQKLNWLCAKTWHSKSKKVLELWITVFSLIT